MTALSSIEPPECLPPTLVCDRTVVGSELLLRTVRGGSLWGPW
jgi:hypothetical protein